jgi:Protein of unknown function (DUF2752)
MQISWRAAQTAETNYEMLWLSVSLGGLCACVFWFALGLPWPGCTFHALTGLPCVTCGATRATIHFFHGQFAAAWNWNPLVFLTLCGIALFDAYAFVVLVTRAPRLRLMFSRLEKRVIRIAAICVVVCSWIYSLSHWRSF